jgi:hypothetical protein
MSDSQMLLSRIAALRQRLDQAQGMASRAAVGPAPEPRTLDLLELKVAEGSRQCALLEESLRQFPESAGAVQLPPRLTARAGRVLKRTQELLGELQALASARLLQDEAGALALWHREAVVMTDTVLRMLQAFPATASVQLRLSEGLEAILDVVAERVATLRQGLTRLQEDDECFQALAGLLLAVAAGQPMDSKPWNRLAERIAADAHQEVPLRIQFWPPDDPVRFVTAHSLTVAQVIARVTRQEPAWRNRPLDPILAALVHDVGMLSVPREILCDSGPLNEAQRRAVELHAYAGAEFLARIRAEPSFLAEAAAYHHERLDGTGYPAGLRDMQIAPLVRLLSICDIYAAMCAQRPYRRAFDTRTALTDTLLLAEQGALDRQEAELLLKLSFYPTGTLVELADGATGLVVATHQGRRDLSAPARPVVALLTDARGQTLAVPQHVDLGACEGRSIVRSLPATERRRVLGRLYPALV